jgi:hypothetical protein
MRRLNGPTSAISGSDDPDVTGSHHHHDCWIAGRSELGQNDDVYVYNYPLLPIYIMLLLARSFKRQAFRVGLNSKPFYSQPQVGRCYTTLFQRSATRPSRILRVSAAGGGALTATLMLCWGYSLYVDIPSPPSLKEPTPLSKLLTSYVVYSACSIPGLVDASPDLLALCTSIPGLRQLTETFVRVTFFKQVFFHLLLDEIGVLITGNAVQFVGGDTVHECLPLIRKLRAENKGTLLAYAVEADGAEPEQPIAQMIRTVEVAARFEDSLARESSSSGRRTWVAVKLVGLHCYLIEK